MERNIFYAIAQHLWRNGANGEEIAGDLAQAFRAVIVEAKGNNISEREMLQEYMRLCDTDEDRPKVTRSGRD